jgi:hypothetical protein
VLESCTLADNQTTGGPGGDGTQKRDGSPVGRGGDGGSGGPAQGGALHGTYALNSCTIASNRVTGGAAGHHTPSHGVDGSPGLAAGAGVFLTGVPDVLNCIIAGNPGAADNSDVAGTVTSRGWNLIGVTDGSSGWTTDDFLGNSTTPLLAWLGPCQDNGGPVWTICPLSGSPARDKGFSDLATDARGGKRIVDFPSLPNAVNGNGSDIGALEVDSLFGNISITRTPTSARVKFKTDPGNTYTLQQTSVLTNLAWTNLVGTVSGNGREGEATDSGPLPPTRFYRVRSAPSP